MSHPHLPLSVLANSPLARYSRTSTHGTYLLSFKFALLINSRKDLRNISFQNHSAHHKFIENEMHLTQLKFLNVTLEKHTGPHGTDGLIELLREFN